MRHVLILTLFTMANHALAWNSLAEMDVDVCRALTNNVFLMSESFTNQLNAACNSGSDEMKSEAYMLLSIHAYENFLHTADSDWLRPEMFNASNSVEAINMHTNKWQFWMSRFLLAGACCSVSNYEMAYALTTNSIQLLASSGYTNHASMVEHAILRKYEMDGLEVADAMRVMAGMSAAELGMGDMATNFANQVSTPYRNIIFDFVR